MIRERERERKMGNTLSSTMKEGTTLLASFIDHHPYIETTCYCFELLLRVFLKCLGLDFLMNNISFDDEDVDEDNDVDESITKEIEKKSNEDFGDTPIIRSRGLVKKPPKKPISSGGGGQINSASS